MEPFRISTKKTIFESPTFEQDLRIRVNEGIGTASISPSGRDVVLASQNGLHIVDLDSPYAPPRRLRHETPWMPADVQWSPFASRHYWIVSTSNQRVLVWNLEMSTPNAPIEHVLHGHTRAITDINFSQHHPDMLATCAVGGFVHCWDLRTPARPAASFTDWNAGGSQVKWSLRNSHVLASSHDRYLRIWDNRKGATPIKSINAHSAKIYGVDWSHEHSDQLLTCSLDSTTKIWAFEKFGSDPIRVIKTPVPVRQARHTPFGSGIIAMPQRGEHKLHLYDLKRAPRTAQAEPLDPDYSFKGHRALARDFLWRSRGTLEHGTETRDFQLITWGADNELILHRMREKHLKLVGYERGATINASWPQPGRGSPYTSFRDPPQMETPPTTMSSQIDLSSLLALHPLPNSVGSVGSPGMKRAPIPMTRNQVNGALTMTYSSIQSKNIQRTDNDLIAWMKGVKFGKRTLSGKRKRNMSMAADAAESHHQTETLSEEIIHVGETFSKVTFEEIDVSGRRVVVSFNGPWAPDRHMVFLRLRVRFPQEYPEQACPVFVFERLSTVAEERLDELEASLVKIADAHLPHQLGCLQAVLFYLLGEYSLEQSIRWLAKEEKRDDTIEVKDDGSSSDEEENLGEFVNSPSQTLDADSVNITAITMSNANVPLSNTCGATFARDGRLVCFFLPKREPPSMLGDLNFEHQEKRHALFEGFGKLRSRTSPRANRTGRLNNNEVDRATDSEASAGMTSDSSSESEEDVDALARKFHPPRAWKSSKLSLRRPQRKTQSTDGSQHMSIPAGHGGNGSAGAPIVSIYVLEDLLPHKHSLATEYQMHGDVASTCSYNALIAENHGLTVTANIWHLLGLVLAATVPLAYTKLPSRDDEVLLMVSQSQTPARKDRAFLKQGRSYGPDSDIKIKGDVKWSNHPFGSNWLIKTLFEYLDQRADVQSLAMLACVLARPSTSIKDLDDPSDATETEWPSPFLEYSTLKDVIKDGQQLSLPHVRSATQAVSGRASRNNQFNPPAMVSRMSSSMTNERRADQVDSPRVMDAQPSSLLSENLTFSSRGSEVISNRQENGSFAASAWARSFNTSSSPPSGSIARQSPAKTSFEDHHITSSLSTVAGSVSSALAPVRSKQSIGSTATVPRSFMAYELTPTPEDHDSGSDTECDEPTTPPEEVVSVVYKNKAMFDDEGSGRVPLLNPEETLRNEVRRNAYADILDAWGLLIEKQEVLKYNGISTAAEFGDEKHQSFAGHPRSSQRTVFTSTFDSGTCDREGLAMTRCCISCGYAGQASGLKGEGRCVRCAVSMRILNCSICLEPVDALLKSCLHCGHVAHLRCLALLSDQADDEERTSRNFMSRRVECEAGYGCECSDFEARFVGMKS